MAVAPGLDEAAVEGSLFVVLTDRYGISPGAATSTIDAAICPDAATAEALAIGEHVLVPAHSAWTTSTSAAAG